MKIAHLVFLGEGGTEWERVRDLAERLAPENIHFVPRTPYVGNFLRDIDIYVNVAIAEGFGIATCEAMLMKKAVIAAQAGALPEYCFHERNSILVPPNNAVALAKAMDRLLQDEELRNKLGANACIDVAKRFTADRYIKENNAVCYEAVGRRSQ
jgi:glycosyltransferase involved in cell wall biosynthesis